MYCISEQRHPAPPHYSYISKQQRTAPPYYVLYSKIAAHCAAKLMILFPRFMNEKNDAPQHPIRTALSPAL